MSTELRDVTIVIVTYKTDQEVLRSCFMSLAAAYDVNFDVVVVDNAGDKKMPNFVHEILPEAQVIVNEQNRGDRKSTRLNSSHSSISYAVFCLKKENNNSDGWPCVSSYQSTDRCRLGSAA